MSGGRRRPTLTPGVLPALRVLATSAALLVVLAALPWLRGEDPATTVLRMRFTARGADADAVAALRDDLDLPANPVAGALAWLGSLLQGDLGESWVSGEPVATVIAPAAATSAALAAAALLVAILVATLLLAVPTWRSAASRRPLPARLGALAVTLASLPEVVLALAAVLVGAVWWDLFPATGWTGASSVVLPALALGLPSGGLLARIVSSAVDATVTAPWVQSWQANGVGPLPVLGSVVRRVVALGAPQAVVVVMTMLGSSVAVEKVFALHGLGTVALDATLGQDLPVLQAAMLLFVLTGLVLMGAAVLLSRSLSQAPSAVTTHPTSRYPARRSRIGVISLVVGVGVVIVGLPRDGNATDLELRLARPSLAHPMGADAVGHDLLGRIAEASVRTVGLAVLITAAALLVALLVSLPMRSARLGGLDVLNTVPSTLVGIVIALLTGPGLVGACLAVLAVAWIPLAVHGRTAVVAARTAAYVEAARLAGARPPYVMVVHLLPAVWGPLLRHALARIPVVALGIAGLSFIGLGADPDTAELGAVLSSGLGYFEAAPWVVGSAAGVVVLLGIAAGSVRTEGR
jgi:peptide/nickel transport system permease protein